MTDKSGLARWVVPAAIAAVVVALVVLALVRDPVQLDPETPEGTVQGYLQAVSEERWEDAHEVLDPQRFADCGPADIAAHSPGQAFTASLQAGDAGMVVERFEEIGGDGGETTTTTPPEDEAAVEVTLRFSDSGPFGSGGWTTFEIFDVVSRDGFWWISGDPWPHFGWSC